MSSIKFSDKYTPLFDLLIARSEVERLSSENTLTTHEPQRLKYFEKLASVDTVLLSGGRDSGKTFALSCFNVIGVADYGHRILYTRQTMSSTDNSIGQAVADRMELLGLDHEFEFANNNYTLKNGNLGKISITGQKTSVGTQTAKLKSLEDYSIFETDEGEELTSYDDWLKIKRSMRAKDVQCLSIICFNPPTREHWIAQEFYENIEDGFNGTIDNILYIHTTYLDNGQENMAEHNWIEYEDLRLAFVQYLTTPKEEREYLPKQLIKKYKEYKFNILGSFKEVAEGVIYEDWEIGAFDSSLPHGRGLDFGSNDPDAMVKCAVDEGRKRIYLHEELFRSNQSTDALIKAVKATVQPHELIIADSAGKRSIQDLYEAGLNIESCVKGVDSVVNGIKLIQGYTLIVTPESENLIKALRNYRWNDKKAGVPHHDWSDLLDAVRYIATRLIQYNVNYDSEWE